jgi:hypothetical protein
MKSVQDDFWNHSINPITGYVVEKHEMANLVSSYKYIITPFVIPKEIKIRPYSILYDKIISA